MLQTYFSAEGRNQYCLVSKGQPGKAVTTGLSVPEKEPLRRLEEDVTKAKVDANNKGLIV